MLHRLNHLKLHSRTNILNRQHARAAATRVNEFLAAWKKLLMSNQYLNSNEAVFDIFAYIYAQRSAFVQGHGHDSILTKGIRHGPDDLSFFRYFSLVKV